MDNTSSIPSNTTIEISSEYIEAISPWFNFIDPGLWTIFFCAIFVQIYGAHRAFTFFETYAEEMELETNNVVHSKLAIILPITGSIMLVLLFYFLNIMFYLLLILMSFMTIISIVYIFYPFFDKLIKVQACFSFPEKVTLPKLGDVPFYGLVSFIFSVFIVIIWLTTFFWVITDFIAVNIAISSISFIRLPNLKVATILLVAYLIFDVIWVDISPLFFSGKSVMIEVATKIPHGSLPMLISVPYIISGGTGGLGLGDIVLPGLFLTFLYRYDAEVYENKKMFRGKIYGGVYFKTAVIGYTVGLLLAYLGVILMRQGQPALLYLVPCTLIPTFIRSKKQKEFSQIWYGVPKRKEVITETELEGDQEALLNEEETV